MDFGISKLLFQDLLQNKNLTPRIAYSTNTTDKVNVASLFNDYYIDGEFDVKDGKYYITTYIRDARNAEITKQCLFEGDLDGAEKNLKKMDLLIPEKKHQTKIFKDALNFLKTNKVTKADLKAFEGVYRSNDSEQTYDFWIENNTLLQYVSNQMVIPYLVSGEDNLLSGSTNLQRIWNETFVKDDTNNYY